jgi:hypothetical protein
MTTNNAASSLQVIRSTDGRLTVLLDRDFEPREVLAALSEAADESRRTDLEPFASGPVRRSPRPYAGEFLG